MLRKRLPSDIVNVDVEWNKYKKTHSIKLKLAYQTNYDRARQAFSYKLAGHISSCPCMLKIFFLRE